jgi:acetyltransferase-like isoleucine patch superfamily enzyme
MIFANITLGENVQIDPTSTINNLVAGDNVKIARFCSLFGAPQNVLRIGAGTYVGMFSIINGFARALVIGARVSIAQHVNIMTDSGPNASPALQRLYPIESSPVTIGDDCWIGANSVILPGVELGRFCIVAANSCVKSSFPDFSIIGGAPARLIRSFTKEEIEILTKK